MATLTAPSMKRRLPKPASELEAALALHLQAAGISWLFVREFQDEEIFGRKFRWDFAAPTAKLLIELQGGVWVPGLAHSGGRGTERDARKMNCAGLAGWTQLSFTKSMIESGEALRDIQRFLEGQRDHQREAN
jgi:very-short-patch-repair endonuclease